ncbi:hypothetical protein RMATCC62417_06398 [Rhizopus microsporus]|nr:hypothetical protein RMATCC62417_06398 [Rhizopus microsporus]
MKAWSAKPRTQDNSIAINVSGVNRGIIVASSKSSRIIQNNVGHKRKFEKEEEGGKEELEGEREGELEEEEKNNSFWNDWVIFLKKTSKAYPYRTLDDFKKNIRKVPAYDEEEEATFDFLEAVLKAIHVSYLVKQVKTYCYIPF